MKKKIKDLTVKDIPNCWSKLFSMNPAFMCLFTEDEKAFNNAKATIPNDLLEKEVEVDE